MDNLNYLNLWSDFINKDNELANYITNFLQNISNIPTNIDILLEKSLNYFEIYKNIDTVLSNSSDTNIEKLFKAYIEARLGIIAVQFYKLKSNESYIYTDIIYNLKNKGYIQIEELLYDYHEKLLENYTPYDIHIISGGNEKDYSSWY